MEPCRLPLIWEEFLAEKVDFGRFYREVDAFLINFKEILPDRRLIFNVFHKVHPDAVRCVIFGEDPYPRRQSACGIAFWDLEITDWSDKTNGNSLKNILKALLVEKGYATYQTSIQECRVIVREKGIINPPDLFESWLEQGVFLLNTALTFSRPEDKKHHFLFWRPFLETIITQLNNRDKAPFYVLWGSRAQKLHESISRSVINPENIIQQNHPTFIHQFLDKNRNTYSPFTELTMRTGIRWL